MTLGKRIILILSLCVLAGCGIYLGKYFYDSYTAHENIARIQQLVDPVDTDTTGDTVLDDIDVDETPSTPEPEKYAGNGMILGYYNAYRQNNDMVGWLKISGTKINYPVMYRDDSNEYYLHRNFDGDYQYSGLPFLDMQCSISPQSTNLIVYAHNMKDGSMFASLTDYDDKDYFKNHQIINFDTNYKRETYQVFAVFSTKVGGKNEFKYHEYIDMDTAEFEEYVSNVKKLSFYDTGITAVWGDELLTLSTCSYHRSDERTVVVAKKVK